MRLIYLDLDALTPSHLGCYGYCRDTSPHIDKLAGEGVRFTNAYCADAPCLPSRTGLYSGRFGIQSGVVGHGGRAAQPRTEPATVRGFRDTFDESGLARQMQDAGMHTAMISPFGQRHAAHWFYAGFDEIHNTGGGGIEIVEDVEPTLDRWLDQNAAGENWFLHVNYWDIHTPYRTPEGYGEPFAGNPIPEWYTDELIARHTKRGGPHSATDLGMYGDGKASRWPRSPDRITDRASLTHWLNGYDTAIRYVDDAIGRMVEKLKKLGIYDDTAIVISADHGENHGELGIYGEHGTADHGTCNIPLIIKWPGGATGKVEHGLHYQLDLVPTYAELMKLKTPDVWDGESFAEAVRTGAAAGRDELILSQMAHVCQRSVRWDAGDRKWLYMRTYHDGYHPFGPEMLYDLTGDPHEQHDLADTEPAVCGEGARRLSAWHAEQMARVAARYPHDPIDPLNLVLADGGPFHAQHPDAPGGLGQPHRSGGLATYVQRLRDTGRGDHADRIERQVAITDIE
jgi:arylsulfatase A-like enzyme